MPWKHGLRLVQHCPLPPPHLHLPCLVLAHFLKDRSGCAGDDCFTLQRENLVPLYRHLFTTHLVQMWGTFLFQGSSLMSFSVAGGCGWDAARGDIKYRKESVWGYHRLSTGVWVFGVHMPGQGIHSFVHILCSEGEPTSQHFLHQDCSSLCISTVESDSLVPET